MKKAIAIIMVLALSLSVLVASVTEDEAVSIALSDAGIAREDAEWLRSHRDRDDGRLYYDVEFRSADGKWEYEIDSESGRIVGFEFDEEKARAIPSGGIDRAEAERVALSDAGLDRGDVSAFRMESDREHGMLIYEVSFRTSDSEYEYDISSEDGTVLKASWEKRGRVRGDRDSRLSNDEAESIALEAIGGDADRISVWEERDDGRYWYEATAEIDGYRFEVDIAGTGEVVSIERSLRGF